MAFISRAGWSVLLLLAAAWTSGCGGGKSTPTTPTPATTSTSPSPSPSTITRVTIVGNVTLSAIGETSQLTASAIFNDNSTKDVTSLGSWQVIDARVINVSPGGILSATGLGATWIAFSYQSRSATQQVTVTPSGTFVIAGRVREPGLSGLPNVEVVDTMSHRSATTDADGLFSLPGLPQLRAHLTVQKEEYEPIEVDVTEANVDLPVQRVVRLTAGQTVTPAKLAPNDLTYIVGGARCSPCRLIRVIAPQSGILHMRITWSVTTASRLSLFAAGQVVDGTGDLNVDVAIDSAREVLVYLGAVSVNIVKEHTTFTVDTSMR